jgi:hypothetical protein
MGEKLMANLIEPIEIQLDRARKILLNHRALRQAESEFNRRRFAAPKDYVNIDAVMVEAYNNIFRMSGMMPRDLLACVLWAGLLNEDPKLSLDDVDDLLDQSPLSDAELSGIVWAAYFKAAGRNLKQVNSPEADEEKKTADQPTGSGSGPSRTLN